MTINYIEIGKKECLNKNFQRTLMEKRRKYVLNVKKMILSLSIGII